MSNSIKLKLAVGALFTLHGAALGYLGHTFPSRSYWIGNICPMLIVAIITLRKERP